VPAIRFTYLSIPCVSQVGVKAFKVSIPGVKQDEEEPICPVTVTEDSRIVRTSCDTRRVLPVGETVRIQKEYFTVSSSLGLLSHGGAHPPC
jgi:hypothetical protein